MNEAIIKIWEEPGFSKKTAYVGLVRCRTNRKKYKIDLRWTPDHGDELAITAIKGDREGRIEACPADEVTADELGRYIWAIDWEKPFKSMYELQLNPYQHYAHVEFCIDQFLDLARKYRHYFIAYCEIVITENGLIFLATPRHADIEEWLRKKGFENICKVWYRTMEVANMTKDQRRILDILEKEELIKLEEE